jgi:hypothetical protein
MRITVFEPRESKYYIFEEHKPHEGSEEYSKGQGWQQGADYDSLLRPIICLE